MMQLGGIEVIDWHSHILPGMDDGSRDTAESLSLLHMLKEQGVDTVIATPHFYANDERADAFLARRQRSLDDLQTQLPADAPNILLGAEVKYYPGISRMAELPRLCIGESRLLLLEMPLSRWTEYTVRELEELSRLGTLTVLLAHIERYLKLQSGDTLDRLCDDGILMQSNASFFTERHTRKKALAYLRSGTIRFIGSDCHGVEFRPPHIGDAFRIIEKKLGDDYLGQIREYGYSMLAYK